MLTVNSIEKLNLFLILKEGLIQVLNLHEDIKIEGLFESLKEIIDDSMEEDIDDLYWLENLYNFIRYESFQIDILSDNDIKSPSDLMTYLEDMSKGVNFDFTLTTQEQKEEL